jgi:hypothetical protein
MFDRTGNLTSLPGILTDYGARSCGREQEFAQSVASPNQTTECPPRPSTQPCRRYAASSHSPARPKQERRSSRRRFDFRAW